MPEKKIRKLNNTEQDSFSDSDDSRDASNRANELVNPNSDNQSFLNWFIANFLASVAMTIFFMIILVRNQSKSALINPRTEIAAPLNFPLQAGFFSVIEEQQDWLKQIQFSIDESILHSQDYRLAQTYIKRQKKLLASIPLSHAQKMALSKTTIYWVSPSLINPPNKAISYSFVLEPRKIVIGLHKGLSKAELRSTLLNEIHHVTVYEINQYKLKDKLITENILEFPFVNEHGELDNSLRAELSIAIDELNQTMKDFISLEANKYRNPFCQKKNFLAILMPSAIINQRFIG